MLRVFTSIEQLSYWKLMGVYLELNTEKAATYRRKERNAALHAAEQDMYAYLQHCFFKKPGSFLAVWESDGVYASAVRVERYADGWLINALETAPDKRRRGFGRQLLLEALKGIDGPVYSHVHKENKASLALHKVCGFAVISDESELLNGSISNAHYTLLRVKES